jgi:alanine-glyoxylate transaminase / serine-glyoxylate transaminase / serine-pyruvate transaminase
MISCQGRNCAHWHGVLSCYITITRLSAERLKEIGNTQVPEGVDAMAVVKNAMDTYKVEIAGGLGPSAGKAWRVGLLGYNAQPQNVKLVLEVFRDGLQKQGKL